MPEHQQHDGFRIVRYGPGESVPPRTAALERAAPSFLRGDFILTHSSGFYGMLIRFGQRLRYFRKRDRVYAHWNHAAIFINEAGEIIEALNGVQQRNISAYKNTEYVVVHLPDHTSPADRDHAVEFAHYCLGQEYGWLTVLSIALCLLTGTAVNFGVDGQEICSALVARALERTGEIFPENEPWHLMPADLASHFEVELLGAKGAVPPKNLNVQHYSRPGKRRGEAPI